jgi:N6-adenosine-specific RNA methylase IME4
MKRLPILGRTYGFIGGNIEYHFTTSPKSLKILFSEYKGRLMDYVLEITTAWNNAREEIIRVGQLIAQAKEYLPHGKFTKMIESELPFSANTAQRLMRIGMDDKLANPAHAQLLPNAWSTLHELTKLDSSKFYECIIAGKIRPDMTRKEAIQMRVGELEGLNSYPIAFPKNTFSILYIDPPWHYGGQKQFGSDNKQTNGASVHYNTIRTEEMMKWDIPSLCDDDCLLFMWSTNPHLSQAIKLGEAWQFEYSTIGFIWHKQKTNPSSYTMSECEICLIFKKGKIPKPRGERNIRQFLSEKRTTHSTKPNEVIDRITKMFPSQKKLEMFSRKQLTTSTDVGWTHWGDEVKIL